MDTTLGKLIIEEDLQMIHLHPEFAVISKNIIYVQAYQKMLTSLIIDLQKPACMQKNQNEELVLNLVSYL